MERRGFAVALESASWVGLALILYSYIFFNKLDDPFPGYKALVPCRGCALFILANFVRYETVQPHSPISEEASET